MNIRQRNDKPNVFTRSICFSLSAAFFITNVVGAQAPKPNDDSLLKPSGTSFWSERQKAVKAAQEYAQLSGNSPVSPFNKGHTSIPSFSKGGLGRILPDITGIEAKAKQQSAANIPVSIVKNGPAWLRSLPYNYGTLEEFYVSPRKESPVIVFVQDVHGHYEAQLNIANIIQQTMAGSAVVGLEGAVGAFDFSPYRAFPNKEINKEVADYFLKSGLISGPEYVGLVSDTEPMFWGVEDKDTYLANIEAFKESLPLRDNARKQIENATRRLVDSKRKVYSPGMLALDDKIETYRNGTLGLGEYLEYLSRPNVVAQFIGRRSTAIPSFSKGGSGRIMNNPPQSPFNKGGSIGLTTTPDKSGNYNSAIQNSKLTKFPNIRLFLDTFKLEKTINFQKVEDERRILIEKLVSVLNKKELEDLVYQAVAHRMGNIDNSAYYHELESICQKHRLKLSNWPELARYVRYSIGADKIDRHALYKEINKLEENVVAQFIKRRPTAPDESGNYMTTAPDESGNYTTTTPDKSGNYMTTTPDKSGNYMTTAPDKSGNYMTAAMEVYETSKYISLVSKLIDNNLTDEEWERYKKFKVKDPELRVQKLEVFEKFYEVATSRNKILIENLLETANNRNVVAQFTGGEAQEAKHSGGETLSSFRIERRLTDNTTTTPDKSGNYTATAPDKSGNYTTTTPDKSGNYTTTAPDKSGNYNKRNDATNAFAVLVAGGFHTQSMAKLLKEKQISYAILSPKLTEIDKDSHYLEVFAQKPTQLDKLMLGEKIFLSAFRNMGSVVPLAPSQIEVRHNLLGGLQVALGTMGLNSLEVEQAKERFERLIKRLPAIKDAQVGDTYKARNGDHVVPVWINGHGFAVAVSQLKDGVSREVNIEGQVNGKMRNFAFTIRPLTIKEKSAQIIPITQAQARKISPTVSEIVTESLKIAAVVTLVAGALYLIFSGNYQFAGVGGIFLIALDYTKAAGALQNAAHALRRTANEIKTTPLKQLLTVIASGLDFVAGKLEQDFIPHIQLAVEGQQEQGADEAVKATIEANFKIADELTVDLLKMSNMLRLKKTPSELKGESKGRYEEFTFKVIYELDKAVNKFEEVKSKISSTQGMISWVHALETTRDAVHDFYDYLIRNKHESSTNTAFAEVVKIIDHAINLITSRGTPTIKLEQELNGQLIELKNKLSFAAEAFNNEIRLSHAEPKSKGEGPVIIKGLLSLALFVLGGALLSAGIYWLTGGAGGYIQSGHESTAANLIASLKSNPFPDTLFGIAATVLAGGVFTRGKTQAVVKTIRERLSGVPERYDSYKNPSFHLVASDMSSKSAGAYTGDTAKRNLLDSGVSFVIIDEPGKGEDSIDVRRRLDLALNKEWSSPAFTPVLKIGIKREKWEQGEQVWQNDMHERLSSYLAWLRQSPDRLQKVVIAPYVEGVALTVEEVSKLHDNVRQSIQEIAKEITNNQEISNNVRVILAGTIAENTRLVDYLKLLDVDGVLFDEKSSANPELFFHGIEIVRDAFEYKERLPVDNESRAPPAPIVISDISTEFGSSSAIINAVKNKVTNQPGLGNIKIGFNIPHTDSYQAARELGLEPPQLKIKLRPAGMLRFAGQELDPSIVGYIEALRKAHPDTWLDLAVSDTVIQNYFNYVKSQGWMHFIIGHSERRKFHGETDEDVNAKARLLLKFGLIPIIAIGEDIEDRYGEPATWQQKLANQIAKVTEGLTSEEMERIVIAYEPLFAIGTGADVGTLVIQETTKYIREQLAGKYGTYPASRTRILYGGSVKPSSSYEISGGEGATLDWAKIAGMEDTDGMLVGTRSLNPDDAAKIIERMAINAWRLGKERRPVVILNWKMNVFSLEEAQARIDAFYKKIEQYAGIIDVILATDITMTGELAQAYQGYAPVTSGFIENTDREEIIRQEILGFWEWWRNNGYNTTPKSFEAALDYFWNYYKQNPILQMFGVSWYSLFERAFINQMFIEQKVLDKLVAPRLKELLKLQDNHDAFTAKLNGFFAESKGTKLNSFYRTLLRYAMPQHAMSQAESTKYWGKLTQNTRDTLDDEKASIEAKIASIWNLVGVYNHYQKFHDMYQQRFKQDAMDMHWAEALLVRYSGYSDPVLSRSAQAALARIRQQPQPVHPLFSSKKKIDQLKEDKLDLKAVDLLSVIEEIAPYAVLHGEDAEYFQGEIKKLREILGEKARWLDVTLTSAQEERLLDRAIDILSTETEEGRFSGTERQWRETALKELKEAKRQGGLKAYVASQLRRYQAEVKAGFDKTEKSKQKEESRKLIGPNPQRQVRRLLKEPANLSFDITPLAQVADDNLGLAENAKHLSVAKSFIQMLRTAITDPEIKPVAIYGVKNTDQLARLASWLETNPFLGNSRFTVQYNPFKLKRAELNITAGEKKLTIIVYKASYSDVPGHRADQLMIITPEKIDRDVVNRYSSHKIVSSLKRLHLINPYLDPAEINDSRVDIYGGINRQPLKGAKIVVHQSGFTQSHELLFQALKEKLSGKPLTVSYSEPSDVREFAALGRDVGEDGMRFLHQAQKGAKVGQIIFEFPREVTEKELRNVLEDIANDPETKGKLRLALGLTPNSLNVQGRPSAMIDTSNTHVTGKLIRILTIVPEEEVTAEQSFNLVKELSTAAKVEQQQSIKDEEPEEIIIPEGEQRNKIGIHGSEEQVIYALIDLIKGQSGPGIPDIVALNIVRYRTVNPFSLERFVEQIKTAIPGVDIKFEGEVSDMGRIIINGSSEIKVYWDRKKDKSGDRAPAPWKETGVDTVIIASRYAILNQETVDVHTEAGAKKILFVGNSELDDNQNVFDVPGSGSELAIEIIQRVLGSYVPKYKDVMLHTAIHKEQDKGLDQVNSRAPWPNLLPRTVSFKIKTSRKGKGKEIKATEISSAEYDANSMIVTLELKGKMTRGQILDAFKKAAENELKNVLSIHQIRGDFAASFIEGQPQIIFNPDSVKVMVVRGKTLVSFAFGYDDNYVVANVLKEKLAEVASAQSEQKAESAEEKSYVKVKREEGKLAADGLMMRLVEGKDINQEIEADPGKELDYLPGYSPALVQHRAKRADKQRVKVALELSDLPLSRSRRFSLDQLAERMLGDWIGDENIGVRIYGVKSVQELYRFLRQYGNDWTKLDYEEFDAAGVGYVIINGKKIPVNSRSIKEESEAFSEADVVIHPVRAYNTAALKKKNGKEYAEYTKSSKVLFVNPENDISGDELEKYLPSIAGTVTRLAKDTLRPGRMGNLQLTLTRPTKSPALNLKKNINPVKLSDSIWQRVVHTQARREGELVSLSFDLPRFLGYRKDDINYLFRIAADAASKNFLKYVEENEEWISLHMEHFPKIAFMSGLTVVNNGRVTINFWMGETALARNLTEFVTNKFAKEERRKEAIAEDGEWPTIPVDTLPAEEELNPELQEPEAIAVSGPGRTGVVAFLRALIGNKNINLKLINGVNNLNSFLSYIKNDTVYGALGLDVFYGGEETVVDKELNGTWTLRYIWVGNREKGWKKIYITNYRYDKVAEIPFKALGIKGVYHATGRGQHHYKEMDYIRAGAEYVLYSQSAKGEVDQETIWGVIKNAVKEIRAGGELFSDLSCTTKAIAAPVAALMDAGVKILRLTGATWHEATNDQGTEIHDAAGRGIRPYDTLIDTSSGSANAIGRVWRALAGRSNIVAARTTFGGASFVDMTLEFDQEYTKDELMAIFRKSASTEVKDGGLKGVLGLHDKPYIPTSEEIKGRRESGVVVDVEVKGKFARFLVAYDNELAFDVASTKSFETIAVAKEAALKLAALHKGSMTALLLYATGMPWVSALGLAGVVRILRVVDRIFKTKTGDRLLGRYLDSNKINDYLDKKAREMNNSHLWNTLNGREMDAYDSLSNGLRATKIIEGNGKVIVIDAPELMNKHHWALGFTLRSPPEKGGVTHFYVQRAAIEWLADRKNVKSDEEFKALIKLWVEHEQKEKSLISEGFNLRSAHLRTLKEDDPNGKLQNFAKDVVSEYSQSRYQKIARSLDTSSARYFDMVNGSPHLSNSNGKLVITPEISKREGLEKWINDYFELKTAGYRGVTNPKDINDPKMLMNINKVALYAYARALMYKEKYKEQGEIHVNIGGDVRYHTKEFIDLIARIYAAQGITVHVKKDYAPSTIWEMAFSTFYDERQGVDTVTASHSHKARSGIKPASERGSQILTDEVSALTQIMKGFIKQTTSTELEIPYAAANDNRVVFDLEILKAYPDYLKGVLGDEIYKLLHRHTDLKLALFSAGGAAQTTAEPILDKLGLSGVVEFYYGKPDPEFHNFAVDTGPDPTKEGYYTDRRVVEIVRDSGSAALTDPDNDRFLYIEKINPADIQNAKDAGLEVKEVEGLAMVKFSPSQLATLFAVFRLEKMIAEGTLDKDTSYVVSTTYPSTYMIDEIVRKIGEQHGIDIRVVRTQVGWKYVDSVQTTLIEQMENGETLVIKQVDGREIRLKNSKAVVLEGFEESGGINLSGGVYKSKSGNRTIHILPEKDGLQPLLFTAAIYGEAKENGITQSALFQKYTEMIGKYNPQLLNYFRKDVTLFNAALSGPELDAAMAAGTEEKNRKMDFFKGLIDVFKDGGSKAVIAELKKYNPNIELPEIQNVFLAADGPFFIFENGTWFMLRASGTDPILRYYGEGKTYDELIARLNAFAAIDPFQTLNATTPKTTAMQPGKLTGLVLWLTSILTVALVIVVGFGVLEVGATELLNTVGSKSPIETILHGAFTTVLIGTIGITIGIFIGWLMFRPRDTQIQQIKQALLRAVAPHLTDVPVEPPQDMDSHIQKIANLAKIEPQKVREAIINSLNMEQLRTDLAEAGQINKQELERRLNTVSIDLDKLGEFVDLDTILMLIASQLGDARLLLERVRWIFINAIRPEQFVNSLIGTARLKKQQNLLTQLIKAGVLPKVFSRYLVDIVPGLPKDDARLKSITVYDLIKREALNYSGDTINVNVSLPGEKAGKLDVDRDAWEVLQYHFRVIRAESATRTFNYRGKVKEYYQNDFKVNVEPQLDDFITRNFTSKGKAIKYVVSSGIGANEEYTRQLSELHNVTNPKIRWIVVNNPAEWFEVKPEDAAADNTLFFDISRSGDTQETVKTFEFTFKEFPYRVVAANKGPLHELAVRQNTNGNKLILSLPSDIGGRLMRRVTPMVYAPMYLAGMDVKTYVEATDHFDNVLAFKKGKDSLAVNMAEFLLAMFLLNQRSELALFAVGATKNAPLVWSAEEFQQLWMEGAQKRGSFAAPLQVLLLPHHSHKTLEGVLGQFGKYIAVMLLAKIPGKPLSRLRLKKDEVATVDKTHVGLSPDDTLYGLALGNRDRVQELLPTIAFEIDHPTPITAAALSTLWEDTDVHYTALTGQDPNANPEVASVRKRGGERLTNLASAVRNALPLLLVATAVTLLASYHPDFMRHLSWSYLASLFKNPQQVFTLFSTVGLGIGFAVLKFSDIWTTIKEYGEGEAAYKVIDANKGAEYYRDLVDKLQKAGNLGNEKVYKVYLESLGILLSEVIRSAKGMLEPALTGYQEEINEFTQLVSLAAVIYVELGILHGNLKIEGKYDDFVEGIEENLMRQILDQVDETDIELWLQENTPEVVSNISRQKGSEDLRNGTELNGIIKEMFIEDGEIKRQLQEFINTVASFIDKQDYDGFDYYDFYAINKGNYGIKVIMVVDKKFNVSHLKIQISRIDGAEFNPAEIGVINSYSFQVVAEGFKAGEVTVSVLKRLRESRYKDDSNAMVISFQSTWPQGRHTAYEPGSNEITNIPPSQPQQVIQLKMVFSRKAGEVADVRETGELPASSGEQLVVESPAQSSKLVPEVQTYKATPEDVRTGKTLGNVLGYRRFKSMIDSGTTVILNGNKIRESDFNKTKLGAGDLITIIPRIAGGSGKEASESAGEPKIQGGSDKEVKTPDLFESSSAEIAALSGKSRWDKKKIKYLLEVLLKSLAVMENRAVSSGPHSLPVNIAQARTLYDNSKTLQATQHFDDVDSAIKWLKTARENNVELNMYSLGYLMIALWAGNKIPEDELQHWTLTASAVNYALEHEEEISGTIRHIWQYSYPRDRRLMLDELSEKQSPLLPLWEYKLTVFLRGIMFTRLLESFIKYEIEPVLKKGKYLTSDLREYWYIIAKSALAFYGRDLIVEMDSETGDLPNIPKIGKELGSVGDKPLYLLTAVGLLGLGVAALFANGMVDTGAFQSPQVFALLASVSMGAGFLAAASAFSGRTSETKPTQKEFQQWATKLHDVIYEERSGELPNVLLDGVRNYLPKLLGDELRLNNFINLVRNLPYDDGRQFTKLLVGHIYDESDLRTDVAIKSDSIQTGEFYIQMLFALLKFNPELVIKTLTNAAVGKEGLRFSSQMVASAALKKLATLSETMIDVLLDLFGHLGFSAIMDQTKKIKDKEPSIIPPITGGSAEEESKQDNTHAFDLNGLNRSIRTALVVVGVAVNMVVAGFFGLGDITVLGHPVVLTAISVIGFVAGGTLGKFLWMYPYTVRMEDYGLSVKSVPGPNGMNQAEWSYNGERIEDVIALRDHQRRAGLPKRFIDEIESKHEFFASHIVGMFALVPVIGMSLAKGLVKLEIASSPLATRNDGSMVTAPDKSGNYKTTAHQSLSGLERLLAPPLSVMSDFFDNLAQRKRLKLKLTIEESENGMRVARISEVVLRPTRIASLSKLPASYAVKAANYISPEQLPRGRELQNIAEQEQEHVKALKKQLVELNETAKGSANTLKLAGQVHGFELGLAELGNIKDTTVLQAKIKNELNDMLNAVPAKDSVEIKAKINAYKKGINQGYSESKWPVIANNRGDDMVEVGSFEFKDSEAKEHTNPQILNVDVTELASGDTKAVPEHVRVSVKKYQELLGKEHIKPMLVFVSRDTGMENWEENVKMSLVGIADNESLRNAHYISGDELVEAGLLYQIKLGKDEVYNRVKTTAYLKNLPNLLSITRFKATIATNSPYGWEKRDKAVVDEKLEELVESLDIWLFGAGYVINVTDSIGEDYKIQNAIDIGA